ncbi:DEAD/DEAH box family ATP-dependent RNA helicase [Thecamonas trahens ATCC 50062]|uniref:DEAD/DEAH box family ATP-dependent RNA helicase n=1 Tax=Thecamonas trahens ATCC 50062 TaxID=461836 RepID=A0A0L0DCV3_THETB|nr:DEAD/DEAH box family ATP-dependent RNA helicase [Thecamonas trahens ATCC 50062]KNC49143.1 DEAD/DEAH box family ATP-dependent RNA helicase [Thecamonas trahens ATCC 50062]|eukprot:XP_013758168.1 DEAD/DEAH box family ATP-dependent RNA helicase [Thecamonas trahens ATCC 50062]
MDDDDDGLVPVPAARPRRLLDSRKRKRGRRGAAVEGEGTGTETASSAGGAGEEARPSPARKRARHLPTTTFLDDRPVRTDTTRSRAAVEASLPLPPAYRELCEVYVAARVTAEACSKLKLRPTFSRIAAMVRDSSNGQVILRPQHVVAWAAHAPQVIRLAPREVHDPGSASGNGKVPGVELIFGSQAGSSGRSRAVTLGRGVDDLQAAMLRSVHAAHGALLISLDPVLEAKPAEAKAISFAYVARHRSWHPAFAALLPALFRDMLPYEAKSSEARPGLEHADLLRGIAVAREMAAKGLVVSPHTAVAALASDIVHERLGCKLGPKDLTIREFMAHVQEATVYSGQLTYSEVQPPVAASLVSFSRAETEMGVRLGTALINAYSLSGIESLYSHQALALQALMRDGRNVIVTTATDSGKSLIFHAPVVTGLLDAAGGREPAALYIYPTKALAQDQLRSIRQLLASESLVASGLDNVVVDTYDADTSRKLRPGLRTKASVILTNPDMIHASLLGHHDLWASFFARLKYVVLDEAHYYHGVLGSHVALILRRLLRVFRHHAPGAPDPQFIMCSATIANPQAHAQALVPLPFVAVTADGAPRGERTFAVWDAAAAAAARAAAGAGNVSAVGSPFKEAAFLFAELVRHGLPVISFIDSRKAAELALMQARELLADEGLDKVIDVYRAGFLPGRRRQLESQLFRGELLGVTATNALELGVDIGTLSATLTVGIPGSVASLRQQMGRAGRNATDALGVFLPFSDPYNQYYAANPSALLHDELEELVLNPTNATLLKLHLACAAAELGLDAAGLHHELQAHGVVLAGVAHPAEGAPAVDNADTMLFSREPYAAALAALIADGSASQPIVTAGRAIVEYSGHESEPQRAFSIRSYTGADFRVINTASGETVEVLDSFDAIMRVYPDAVYLSEGASHIVTRFDALNSCAWITPADVDYYTEAVDHKAARDHAPVARKMMAVGTETVKAGWGPADVTMYVNYIRKRWKATTVVFDKIKVLPPLPPTVYATTVVWFTIPASAIAELEAADINVHEAIHAYEHLCLSLAPLFCTIDRKDIGGTLCDRSLLSAHAPRIMMFDAIPGGIGIAPTLYEALEQLWAAAAKVLASCPCKSGCPRCVHRPGCGEHNHLLSKAGARSLSKWFSPTSPSSGGSRSASAGGFVVDDDNDGDRPQQRRQAQRKRA